MLAHFRRTTYMKYADMRRITGACDATAFALTQDLFPRALDCKALPLDPVEGRHTFCCCHPRDVGALQPICLCLSHQQKIFYLLIVEGRPWRGRCRTPSPSKAHADTARNTTSDFSSLAREARNHTLFSLCCKAPCWKNDGLTVENHPATIFDGWKVLNWLHF